MTVECRNLPAYHTKPDEIETVAVIKSLINRVSRVARDKEGGERRTTTENLKHPLQQASSPLACFASLGIQTP